LEETSEPHWKKTNVLIVRKRDTGKMNALWNKGWAETPYTSYKLPFPSRKKKLSGHPSPTSYQIVADLPLK
jgi:hypothetical protein